jgi:hypothetical protein
MTQISRMNADKKDSNRVNLRHLRAIPANPAYSSSNVSPSPTWPRK